MCSVGKPICCLIYKQNTTELCYDVLITMSQKFSHDNQLVNIIITIIPFYFYVIHFYLIFYGNIKSKLISPFLFYYIGRFILNIFVF